MGGLPQGPRAEASGLAALAAPWGSSAPPAPHPGGFLPGCLPGLWGELSPSCRGTRGFQMLRGALGVGSHCSAQAAASVIGMHQEQSLRKEREQGGTGPRSRKVSGIRARCAPEGPKPLPALTLPSSGLPASCLRGVCC